MISKETTHRRAVVHHEAPHYSLCEIEIFFAILCCHVSFFNVVGDTACA